MNRIARLDSRAVVRVSGADAKPFLHNLLTQDVETLRDGDLRFAALLSPPGRLLFALFVLGEGDDVLLDVATQRREALIQRLSMYKLRAQVEIADDDRVVFASWPDAAPGFTGDPRTALLGGRAYGGEVTVDATEADYAAHRLALGVPDPSADTAIDRTYPIEANFDLLNGIDFAKGCYVGQETTSRMKRRGTIKNRMLPLSFEGPPLETGAEVLNGERRAGEALTGSTNAAIALMRLDRSEGELTIDGRTARAWRPAWMPDWPRPETAEATQD
ncbi:folate-binding protein YgfZ [soil metagenome]